jgi:hypothetical protein
MRYLLSLTAFFAFLLLSNASPPRAEEPKQANTVKDEPNVNVSAYPMSEIEAKREVVNLTVYPAPIPRPALKYHLLPTYLEKKPGNAALLYYRVFIGLANREKTLLGPSGPFNGKNEAHDAEKKDKIARDLLMLNGEYLEKPVKELPAKEIREFFDTMPLLLEDFELAAYRSDCDWGIPWREMKSPINALLSYVQDARGLSRIIALKARCAVAENNPEEAIESLKIGYSLADHLGKSECLIQLLVALSITGVMDEQFLELCQLKSAPNLYWSLTDLPHPFIPLRNGFELESVWPLLEFRELQEARTGEHSPEQWQELWVNFIEKLNAMDATDNKKAGLKLDAKLLLEQKADFVRKQMSARGRSEKEIDAMPPAHMMLLYCAELWDEMRDEGFKWIGVPISEWPGAKYKSKTVKVSDTTSAEMPVASEPILERYQEKEIVPLSQFLCACIAPISAHVRVEQTFSALRCIEALRLYAHSHDGKLPDALENITEVPWPIDPRTSKPMAYRLEGENAVISFQYPIGWSAIGKAESNSMTREYRVKIAK